MNIRNILLLLFFLTGISRLNAALNVDSLKTVAKKSAQDTLLVKIYVRLGKYYSQRNADSSVFYYKEALALSKALNYTRGYFKSSSGLGWAYFLSQKFHLGDSISELLLTDKRSLPDEKYAALYNLHYFRSQENRFSESLKYLLMAEKVAGESHDSSLKFSVSNAFGNLYSAWGEKEKDPTEKYRKSLFYYKKADSLALRYNMKKTRVNLLLINLALGYQQVKEYNKAEEYYEIAFRELKNSDNQTGYALALSNYCDLKISMYQSGKNNNDLIKCIEVSFLAEQKAIESKYLVIIPYVFLNRTQAYYLSGNYEKALETANTYINSDYEQDLFALKCIHETLYNIYDSQQNHKKALEHYKLFFLANDSLNEIKNQKDLNDIEVRYETEKKEKENDLLHAENIISTQKIKAQKNQNLIVLTGLALALVLGLVLFRSYRIKRRANIELKNKNELIDEQKKQVEQQKHLIEEKHKEITDSINYAERIQHSFLASKELMDEFLDDYFVFFKPKDVVSGDFYWAEKLRNGNFVYATADSTGHGVPGAIMSILNISSLDKAIETEMEPAGILNYTRKTIINRLKRDGSAEGGKDGMDCCLVVLHADKKQLSYAAANNALWIVRENKLIELPADKMPAGKHERDHIPFTQHTVELQKGDVIYTFTDGFPDQFGGPKGKKFMYKKFKELLISISDLSMEAQKTKVKEALNEWKGELEQVDDVCIIGVRV